MDNFNDVKFKPIPKDDECIVNAVQIGKRIDEPPHTIRTWAEDFQDFLYIKKVNGRWQYTETSVEQFEIIKKLRRERNFSIPQIKELIKRNGFANNGTELVGKDTFDMEYITSILTQSNQKMMQNLIHLMITQQQEFARELLNQIEEKTSTVVQENVEESINNFKSELYSQLQDISDNIAVTQDKIDKQERDSAKIVSDMRNLLAEHKREFEETKQKNSFFNRLFHRK